MRFEGLQGAAGDVKELEYIAALHQTRGRTDGSIVAEDIRLFLLSRYGIVVTEDEVRSTIISGMAGGDQEDDECIDLMELVAILLIPTLVKAAKEATGETLPEDVAKPPPDLLEEVLRRVTYDVTGTEESQPLTAEFLSTVLKKYGEAELANDKTLIDEMIEGAKPSRSKGLLDHEAFSRGLTSDVRLYDIAGETRFATNEDLILLNDMDTTQESSEHSQDIEGSRQRSSSFYMSQEGKETLSSGLALQRLYVVPRIDVTAETYRSKSLMVFLWTTILLTFFAYMVSFDDDKNVCVGEDEAYEYTSKRPWQENAGAMKCQVEYTLEVWMRRFSVMCASGVGCALLGSLGNEVDCKRAWMPFFGGLFVLFFVFVPFFRYENLDDPGGDVLRYASVICGSITSSLHFRHAYMLLKPVARMRQCLEYYFCQDPKGLPSTSNTAVFAETKIKRAAAQKLVTMTTNALAVASTKESDHIVDQYYGQALQMFAKKGSTFGDAGGFVWTWKRILGLHSFTEDGIWVPARCVASNVGQFVVAIYILYAGIGLTHVVTKNYDGGGGKERVISSLQPFLKPIADPERVSSLTDFIGDSIDESIRDYLIGQSTGTDLDCSGFPETANEIFLGYCPKGTLDCTPSFPTDCDYFLQTNEMVPAFCTNRSDGTVDCSLNSTAYSCALAAQALNISLQTDLAQGSGFNQSLFLDEFSNQFVEEMVENLYPSEKFMVVVPMILATFVAFAVAMYLALAYLPSVTTTILKLRCGVIPTLTNKGFAKYRAAPDQVAILTGGIFWGTFVSSVVVGALVGSIAFFFLWQGTVYYAQRFVAFAIGIILIVIFLNIFLHACRCTMYQSFYRTKPRAANLGLLGLEWANFILAAGFVVVRMIKLVLVACAFIGRLDTPFLAPGVGRVGPIELDGYPIIHLKDILSHEAHRHPYIEQLGMIYLMKLRYSTMFGNRAGSCWRLIFVYELMPWLHRYRLQTRPPRSDDEEDVRHEFEDAGPDKRMKELEAENRRLRRANHRLRAAMRAISDGHAERPHRHAQSRSTEQESEQEAAKRRRKMMLAMVQEANNERLNLGRTVASF